MRLISPALFAAASLGLVALFVLPDLPGAYRLSKWGMSGVVLMVLAALLLAARVGGRQWAMPRERTLVALAAAFAAAAIVLPLGSTEFAVAHGAGMLRMAMGVSFALLTALAFAAEPERRRQGLMLLATIGGACALVVILQALGVELLRNQHFQSAEFRAPGTFGNPNWAAAFLLPLAPLTLALLASEASTSGKRLLRVLLVLIVAATLATLSKAGALALCGGLIVYALLGGTPAGRRRGLAAIVAAAIALTAILALFGDRFTTLSWVQGRLFLWHGALYLAAENPLAGLGLGGYMPAYPRAAAQVIGGDAEAFMPLGVISFLHNDPLQIAVEGGLVTAVLYLALVATVALMSHRRADVLSRGVGAAIIAIFLYGFADSPLQLPATFMLFWFLVGWLCAGRSEPGAEPSQAVPSARHRRIAVTGFVIVALAIGSVEAVRFTAGNLLWADGASPDQRGDRTGEAALRRAVALLPDVGQLRSAYARVLLARGQRDEALRQLEVAGRLYHNVDDLYRRITLLDRAQHQQAWQDLAARFPALITPHFRLGLIHLQRGEIAQARQAFNRVMSSSQTGRAARGYKERARVTLSQLEGLRTMR